MSIVNDQFSAFKANLNRHIVAFGMTFNPSIDCRNDLVNHYGYTRQQVNAMSDDELFSIMDQIEDVEEGYTEPEYSLVNIPCNNCNHSQMYEMDFSDWDDCYTLECPECKHERRIHYTVYDGILESFEYQPETINEPVKVAEVKEDNRSIDDLNLSVRTYNCLFLAGYKTVQQVKNASFDDMMRVRNLGRRSLNEIEETLNIKFL